MKHVGTVSFRFSTGRSAIGFLAIALLCGALVPACRPKDSDDTTQHSDDVNDAGQTVSPVASKLRFPAELHVRDESVNTFLTRAFDVCLGGDYEAFRLLWSAREEPLPRREFERGWVAITEIRVRALEEVALVGDGESAKKRDPNVNVSNPSAGVKKPPADERPEIVYVVYAEVELDPDKNIGNTEPLRQAVLMLVKEHDQWRLANAPKKLRHWLREKVDGPVNVDQSAISSEDPSAGKHVTRP